MNWRKRSRDRKFFKAAVFQTVIMTENEGRCIDQHRMKERDYSHIHVRNEEERVVVI